MKQLINLTYFLFLFFLLDNIFAQAPSIEWQKSYGGTKLETASCIIQTNDSGYIMTGATLSNNGDVSGNHGTDYGDVWVVKIDSIGKIQWQKCLGGSGEEYVYSIKQTKDGGYILAGGSMYSYNGDVSGNHGEMDAWIIKLNASGNIEWQKSFGGSYGDAATCIRQTAEGGYIFAGSTTSNNGDVSGLHSNASDFWIVKITDTGIIEWQKCLGGSDAENANAIEITNDGGYIITGPTSSNDGDVTSNHGSRDYWVVKVNATGVIQWQKCLGGSGEEISYSVKQCFDGGFIVAGQTYQSADGDVSGNNGNSDYWIVKLYGNGNLQWQKCFGGTDFEEAHTIATTFDGGYIVGGSSLSKNGNATSNNGLFDYWLIQLNNTGNLVWQKSIGGSNFDEAFSIQQTKDTGYIVVGSSSSNDKDVTGNHGQADFWVVKLVAGPCTSAVYIDASADSICEGSSITFTATAINGGNNPVYQWKKNGVKVGSNNPVYTAKYYSNDTITCTLTSNASCTVNAITESDKIIVHVKKAVQPIIIITADTLSICSGTTIHFNTATLNGGNMPSYTWIKNNTLTGVTDSTYAANNFSNGDSIFCILKSNEACLISNTDSSNILHVAVTENVTPTINITASAATICSGDSIKFIATVTHEGSKPVFEWMKNGAMAGLNIPYYTDASINGTDIITCNLLSNDTSKCLMTNFVTATAPAVSVFELPKVFLNKDSILCKGTTRILDAGSFNEYLWNNGSTVRTITVNEPGTYSVLVKDNNGCKSSDTTIITSVASAPSAFLPVDTVICINHEFTISSPASYSKYLWSNNQQASAITVTTPGLYWLEVTDQNSCSGRDSILLKGKECLQGIFIPSAFTPNKDGRNDYFKPIAFGTLLKYEFVIYNRWGQIVFWSNNINNGWDGNLKGNKQDTNVFAWHCSYQFQGESLQQKKGTVTILR